MKVEVISASRLTDWQVARWGEILSSQPALDSPFFTPEFVQVVAGLRPQIEVGLLYDNERLAGFFPYQRTRLNVAVPVGVGFSEFHGVIATPDLDWQVCDLLQGCGLFTWKYDHLPVSQTPFARCHVRVGDSPFMDLSGGFDAYCAERRRRGSSIIRQTQRKLRKLVRNVGKVEIQLHDASECGLHKLLEWKSAQHERTGLLDVFRIDWVRELLKRVHAFQSPRFSGVMSVLRCAGQPIAVHLGMRTPKVAHMWYPAYDPAFGEYSPGTILFLEMAREFASQGVVRMDLGPTPQRYKQSLKSGDIAVAIGAADRYAVSRFGRRIWQAGKKQIRASVLAKPTRLPADWLFRLRQWQMLR